MEKLYPIQGTMLVPGKDGKLQPVRIDGQAEEDPAAAEALSQLVLQDKTTGKLYKLWVDNGKLMMEVM